MGQIQQIRVDSEQPQRLAPDTTIRHSKTARGGVHPSLVPPLPGSRPLKERHLGLAAPSRAGLALDMVLLTGPGPALSQTRAQWT